MDEVILINYLRRESSPEEDEQVEQWYSRSAENRQLLEQYYYTLFVGNRMEAMKRADTEKALRQLKQRIAGKRAEESGNAFAAVAPPLDVGSRFPCRPHLLRRGRMAVALRTNGRLHGTDCCRTACPNHFARREQSVAERNHPPCLSSFFRKFFAAGRPYGRGLFRSKTGQEGAFCGEQQEHQNLCAGHAFQYPCTGRRI